MGPVNVFSFIQLSNFRERKKKSLRGAGSFSRVRTGRGIRLFAKPLDTGEKV